MPMNPAYDEVLVADAETRSGLFSATAQRLGTTPQNVEKDFWVCWTLDALFNGLPPRGPRLLFKGGTSLSKGFGLISRFSEDVDVTVFRDDIGAAATVEALQAMSGRKRRATLRAIHDACRDFIQGDLANQLSDIAKATAERAGLAADSLQVRTDPDDDQTLLLWYPGVVAGEAYIRPAVKIESGARSALDPNAPQRIVAYVDADAAGLDLGVDNVITVDPSRTFWDKIVIIHGLRRWFDKRGELRGGGQRISRHYYDLHRLMGAPLGQAASRDLALGADCVAHSRMFFDRADNDLATCAPRTFALVPHGDMLRALRQDYRAMSAMIFGAAPSFDDLMDTISDLEGQLNA